MRIPSPVGVPCSTPFALLSDPTAEQGRGTEGSPPDAGRFVHPSIAQTRWRVEGYGRDRSDRHAATTRRTAAAAASGA
jgi:hypothetical protein